eukprot:gene11383-21579_t
MEKNIRLKMSDGKEVALRQIGNYKFLGRTLGKGNFARVELAEHKLTGAKVAIKIINLKTVKEDYVKRNILREAIIMKKVRHDNVIKLYETLKYDTIYCLVTELVKGGDLRTYVQQQKTKRLSEMKARLFFRQLLSAVKHLHESGVVHRDLKMDNILLDETKTVIKIVDFGLSNLFNKGELLRTHCGSPDYAAPELFEKGCFYGPSVDVWSMGVVLYAMVIGHLPFSTMFSGFVGKDELYNHAKKGLTIAHERYLGRISPGCRHLLTKLIQPDPAKRISFQEMVHYSWVTEDGKNPLVKMPPVLIPKSVRARVIDRVAVLCSKSISNAEMHVQTSSHDAVCAVYNLLLDDAMKIYKTKVKTRAKHRPTSSLGHQISDRKEDGRIVETETPNTRLTSITDEDSGKKCDSNHSSLSKRGTDAPPVVEEEPIEYRGNSPSTSSEKAKSQVSGLKIVEFTDALKLEGRDKSPIIRQPTPVNRYWKTYKPQNEAHTQSAQYKEVKTFLQSEAVETSKKDGQAKVTDISRQETKHQIFCGGMPNSVEPFCKITRFPEEDKSSKRQKVDRPPSIHSADPKQMIFAAGFRMTSLAKKIDAISSKNVSSSFHGCSSKASAGKTKESRSIDNACITKYSRSQSPSVSGRRQSLKLDYRERMLVEHRRMGDGKMVTSSNVYSKARASTSSSQAPVKAVNRYSTRRSSLPSNISSMRNEKRFGTAMSELKRRICVAQSRNRTEKPIECKTERDRKTSETTNKCISEKNHCDAVDRPSNEGEIQGFLETSSCSGKQNLVPKNETTVLKNGATGGICKEDFDNRKDIKETERVVTPQCQMVSLFDDPRRGSAGILKTPSRCSSADFERRKLRVTFEDQVFESLQKASDALKTKGTIRYQAKTTKTDFYKMSPTKPKNTSR